MIKQLEKKEFVKFLKIISHNLDIAEIKHDIPFCHIDKPNWNYINIIIPDFTTSFEIMKILNTTDIKEKSSIIYAKIDDFDVRFIKSSEQMWQYNFYFYAWDTLHILMNVLTSRFSMNYTRNGLYYIYNGKNILLSKNLKDVFDFFDLPFHLITNGFATDFVMFSYIESGRYFKGTDFTLDKFRELDHYYENNIKYYEDFITHKPELESEIPTIKEQIALIDAYFPKSDFYRKLTKIQMKEDFPNLTDKEKIFKENKTVDILLNDKERQIKEFKQKRKINLGKYFKKKDKPGNDEFKLS